MAGHVRRKLLGKGLDPRTFSVIALGGAGPVHVNRLVREVGFRSAIIPVFPGLTSALGCILGRLRHDFVRTVNLRLSAFDPVPLDDILDEEIARGRSLLADEGVSDADIVATFAADMCYVGQTHTVQVPLPDRRPLTADAIRAAFESAYHERFANLLDGTDIRLISIRVAVASAAAVPAVAELVRPQTASDTTSGEIRMYMGGAWVNAAKYRRESLPAGFRLDGPALLTQDDSTTVVEPGFEAVVHPTGNLILQRSD